MTDGSDAADARARLRFEAHALVERRRFDLARAVIDRGLQQFPEDVELLYLAAFIEYAQGDIDGALTQVRHLLRQDPRHYGGRSLMARLHESRKQRAEAERFWLDLLHDYPEDADIYGAYAHLMLQTLNTDKARRLAQEGLRHVPDHADCLFVATLIDLIEGHSGEFVRTHLKRLLNQHPENELTSTALIIALSESGDYRGALHVGQELLRLRPASTDLVELVKRLKVQSHWTMRPLYPMQRWGWAGAAVVTIGGSFVLPLVGTRVGGVPFLVMSVLWLCYVVYSWIWPAMLKRLI